MNDLVLIILIFSLILFSCGCTAPYAVPENTNVTKFAEKINASQKYYDDLVIADPSNATAWVIRGMYYNNAFNQDEEALRSYNRSLALNPEFGLAWYAKGITLQNMQRFNESEICFANAEKYGIQKIT